MKNTIAIITYETYPDGSPGAIRCKSLAEAYMKLGFEVVVLHKGLFEQTANPKVISCFDYNRFKRYFCFEKKIIHQLGILNRANNLQAVITYGFFKGINKWCKSHDVTNVVDVVEWYSKEQFKRWYTAIPYWSKQIEIRRIVRSKPNVIAISSFLKDYFTNNGCKTVRIPIISDELISNRTCLPGLDIIKLIYAGTHPKMDNVPLILKSLLRLTSDERKNIQFSIFGLKEEALLLDFTPTEQNKLKECVVFYGRRPHREVLEAYLNSHFSVFLRNPVLRVNKAGFPSKVVESLRIGVPVLCNYSSDLKLYLKTNVNSIILDELTESKLIETFKRIVNITEVEYTSLVKNAIATVSNKLTTQCFSQALIEILNNKKI